MEITAWCGRCGAQFAVPEMLAPPAAGRCPRCAAPFAPDYTPVVAAAVASVQVAADALAAAGTALREMAPRLHIDTAGLTQALRDALDH